LQRFVESVRAQGPVACQKHEHSSRYRCSTAAGEDIAEAMLLGGVGRAAARATRSYRDAEAQARQKGRGLWAKL
jgi:endonuclease YncB( thermonuclease family)